MRRIPLKSIALLLVVTVTALAGLQSRSEAMLAPAHAMRPAPVNRAADLKTIESTLEMKAIRGKLHGLGLTDKEIQARLSRMSDQQIHQMASQIRAVRPAGDFLIGILVLVLLVVLIIYLIKRI